MCFLLHHNLESTNTIMGVLRNRRYDPIRIEDFDVDDAANNYAKFDTFTNFTMNFSQLSL